MPIPVRPWRQLTVWLHVLTSVGWLACAAVLLVLLLHGEPGAAHVVDTVLLAALANGSACTGLVLSCGTAWGLVVHRWVLAKFAITVVQLAAGIFLLSGALTAAATTGHAPVVLLAGTAVMAALIALQAWLSVAKPGPRTRWGVDRATGRPVKLPTAPGWVFVLGVTAPVADLVLTAVLGFPSPFVQVVALTVVVLARRSAVRGRAPRAVAA
ncbi:hypothetical protein ACQEVB_16145 [Pseudonocardia sp. CA-107938]|uniref:hypothetical protein n=1 Tax=Pseudonocardia sp. CA-107938 TaxID=3240021 RepID=UPI003D92AE93